MSTSHCDVDVLERIGGSQLWFVALRRWNTWVPTVERGGRRGRLTVRGIVVAHPRSAVAINDCRVNAVG